MRSFGTAKLFIIEICHLQLAIYNLKAPSTIPPELCFTKQFIAQGKHIMTTVAPENGPPPSELKLARRIGFATHSLFKIRSIIIASQTRNFAFCILNFEFPQHIAFVYLLLFFDICRFSYKKLFCRCCVNSLNALELFLNNVVSFLCLVKRFACFVDFLSCFFKNCSEGFVL